jgi:hypothetical protein
MWCGQPGRVRRGRRAMVLQMDALGQVSRDRSVEVLQNT